MDWRMERVLTFLNRTKIRATYSAVGEALGELSGQTVGGMLGERRPIASWVVNSKTGRPTNYETTQCHPDLYKSSHIHFTGIALLRHMAGLAE